jgi:acetyl/propionyl-CoA carboxylase alpha subunit
MEKHVTYLKSCSPMQPSSKLTEETPSAFMTDALRNTNG